MSAATQPVRSSARLPFSRILLAGVIAIVGSVIANLIVGWLGGLIFSVSPAFLPLTPPPTIIFTTLFLVIATAVYAVINLFAANPPRVFNIVALVALILSLIPNVMMLFNPSATPMPLPPESITFGAVLVLMLQHVVAYAITVWAFVKWAPSR
jgi:hypothetical protein